MFLSIIVFSVFFSFFSILEPIFFGKIIEELELFYKTQHFDTHKIIIITIIWGAFIFLAAFLKYIYFQYFISRPNLKYYKFLIDKYSKKVIDMSYGEYL
jgi:hypoxanthine-guanine phosphoribosyltransferase